MNMYKKSKTLELVRKKVKIKESIKIELINPDLEHKIYIYSL